MYTCKYVDWYNYYNCYHTQTFIIFIFENSLFYASTQFRNLTILHQLKSQKHNIANAKFFP